MAESATVDENDDQPVVVGQIIDGRFRVERFIGMGAMGLVVEASHIELGERVAIKFLKRSARKNQDAVVRFAREARAAARLKSAHVAHVHDVGETADGTPYIVMEYLNGMNLDEVLMQRGPFRDVGEAVYCVLQICEAVAEAHSLGIVHRDIKPANLFVEQGSSSYPMVKLLDFGISKAALTGEYTNIELDSTKTATIMGSPYYMAPEQVRSTKDVDARADIWALGAVLFELISGKPIWRSEDLGKLVSEIIALEPLMLRDVRPDADEKLETVLSIALSKDVNARYQTAGELAQALAPFVPPDRAAAHVERALGFQSTVPRSASSLPALRTSSRDLSTGRPSRTTSTRISAPAPARASSSVQIALGIACLALLGTGTALLLRKPAPPPAPITATTASQAPPAVPASAPEAPPPPVAPVPVAAPAASAAPSAPATTAAARAPFAWGPAPKRPNARTTSATDPAPAAAPAPAPTASAGLDNDPYRRAQPKLEDNPFK